MEITSIIVAGLSLIGTMIGSYMSNRKTQAVMEYKIEDLKKQVEKHNSIVERTYKLERDVTTIGVKMDNLREEVQELKEGRA